MAERRFTDELIIESLNAAMGKIYVAARKLGCDPSLIYKRRDENPIIAAVIAENRGVMVDTAEIALWKAIQSGEAWAVCFCLKTQGKDRGYIEKTEQHVTGGTDNRLEVIYTNDWHGETHTHITESDEPPASGSDGPGAD